MSEDKAYLKKKLIGFQKQIADLNHEIKTIQETHLNKETEIWMNILEILDAFENLDDFIESKKDEFDKPARKLAKSIESIEKKTRRFLKANHIVPVEFDDHKAKRQYCKIIDTKPDPGLENETVLEVLKTGYINTDKNIVLRKAEVVTVSNS